MASRPSTYRRLERAVFDWVQRAELGCAIALCEAALGKLAKSDYHAAVGRSWKSQIREASRWLAEFYRAASNAMPVHCIYCEMNRFEINPDEWHIDGFAYDFFGDPEDVEWLAAWKKSTTTVKRLVLRGVSDLQGLFARDYADEPPSRIRAASEVVILLLTLRMQELIHAAASHGRRLKQLPPDLPVLSAAHDSNLVCFSYGAIRPPVSQPEPARPELALRRARGKRLAIYKIEPGYDEFGNSLPWDCLNYVNEHEEDHCMDQLSQVKPLAKRWKAPGLRLRSRKWRCDLTGVFPWHWAINERGRAALEPLFGRKVEFLPVRCGDYQRVWLLHPLEYVDLAANALHDGEPGENICAIKRYAFDTDDLAGKHLFGVHQAPGSPARKGGFSFGSNYVSEEFGRVFEAHGLQGVTFKKVFSYAPTKRTKS
jgi:hypothetical protein